MYYSFDALLYTYSLRVYMNTLTLHNRLPHHQIPLELKRQSIKPSSFNTKVHHMCLSYHLTHNILIGV